MPTIRAFHEVFHEASRINNKPSSVETKEKHLRVHIVPLLGDLRLDQVTYAVVEDFKIALSKRRINIDKTYATLKRVTKVDAKSPRTLSAKTINNCLGRASSDARGRAQARSDRACT